MNENATLLAHMALVAGIAGPTTALPAPTHVLRVLDAIEESSAVCNRGDVPDGAWRVATRAGELVIVHIIGNIED